MINGDPNVLTGRTTSDEHVGRPPRRAATTTALPIERRSEELVRLLKSLGDDPKPREVHLLRTTIRRVETLLPNEGEGGSAERKVRKQLDRVRRRAGKVRDIDVHLKALRTLPRTLDAAAGDALRNALAKAREKRMKRLTRALGDERDRGVVKRLRQAAERVAVVAHAAAIDPERALSDVLDAFAAARRTAEPLGVATLHAFRIATKRLRYRAEVLAASPAAAQAVVELKRVQDAIGAWHDWVTLDARAEKTVGDPTSPLIAAVRARTEAQLGKAITTTERVARRLEKLRPTRRRKGVRRMSGTEPGLPLQRAGAPA